MAFEAFDFDVNVEEGCVSNSDIVLECSLWCHCIRHLFTVSIAIAVQTVNQSGPMSATETRTVSTFI